jgi:hypothetical protein
MYVVYFLAVYKLVLGLLAATFSCLIAAVVFFQFSNVLCTICL